MKKTRAFISIDFSDEIKKEVARIQTLVTKQKFVGKLTEKENLHLTLKFLGEIAQEQLDKVKEKLSEIKFQKFIASLENIGTFSYKGMPRILWLKISGKEILELQKQIDFALKDLFKQEERFMSHLTIARIKYVKDIKNFVSALKSIPLNKIKFQVDNFKLMSSKLTSQGPVYKTLQTYRAVK